MKSSTRSTLIGLGATALAIGFSVYTGGASLPLLLAPLFGEKAKDLSNEVGKFAGDLAAHWMGGTVEEWWKGGADTSRTPRSAIDGINRAIAACLALAASGSKGFQKNYLAEFAKGLEHGKLVFGVEEATTPVKDSPVADSKILDLLMGRTSLSSEEWEALLQPIAPGLSTSPIITLRINDPQRTEILRDAAKILAVHFSDELRKTYKELGAANDPIWQALVFRLLGEIRSNVMKAQEDVQSIMGPLTHVEDELGQLIAALRGGLEDVLQLESDPSSSNLPFLYAKRETPLMGQAALRMLHHDLDIFLNDDQPVRWWLWTGLEGAGKSRLALEACIKARGMDWKAGFVSRIILESFKDHWTTSNIYGNFLLVFDDVGLDPVNIREALYHLAARAKDARGRWRVKILLLERNVTALKPTDTIASLPQWAADLFASGPYLDDIAAILNVQYPSREAKSFHLEELDAESARTVADKYLASLDDRKKFANSGQALTQQERAFFAGEALRLVGQNTRPLLVMIAARVLRDSDKKDFKDFDEVMILWLKNRLPLRRQRLVQAYNETIAEQLLNLLCVATVVDQLRLADVPAHSLLPSVDTLRDKKFLALFEQNTRNDFISKLEPDLVGEWYVLYRSEIEELKHGHLRLTPESLSEIVDKCPDANNGLKAFVQHTYRHFHDRTLPTGQKSALWRVLRGSLGRYATTFGEVFDRKQAKLLRGNTEDAEKRYHELVIKSIKAAIERHPKLTPIVVDLMAGGPDRPGKLLEEFGDRIHLLAIDRDISRLQNIKQSEDVSFHAEKVHLNEGFKLAGILNKLYGRTHCDVIIAKKALHELPWPVQLSVISDMAGSLSSGGTAVLYADSPVYMDEQTCEAWAGHDKWLQAHLPIDGADDSPEVRRRLFPPRQKFVPGDPSDAALFINYWIKLKDWANYNISEYSNRFFSSANQITDAFTQSGLKTVHGPEEFHMEIQAKRFVEEAMNRLGYLYVDRSLQPEELENIFLQNHRYPLFWEFVDAHLMENGMATPFGKSVGARMEDAALRELMPESFLKEYDRLSLPDLQGPSLHMPIHVFAFQKL